MTSISFRDLYGMAMAVDSCLESCPPSDTQARAHLDQLIRDLKALTDEQELEEALEFVRTEIFPDAFQAVKYPKLLHQHFRVLYNAARNWKERG